MKSLDTNILFTGCHAGAEGHESARDLLVEWSLDDEVVICEFVLVEFYNLLRNSTVMAGRPLGSAKTVELVQAFRHHPKWRLVDSAPVMEKVWQAARAERFPRRRIFDARIAFTLLHHGVKDFATVNVKDFRDFGFKRVWNPLEN
jgi:toxin-antitoxin system PIN domain toxin